FLYTTLFRSGRDRVRQGDDAVVHVREVDDLDAAAALGPGVGVRAEHADVAPQAGGPRDLSDEDRVARLRDLDDRGAVRVAEQRVLAPGRRRVAEAGVPVAARTDAEVRQRHPREQRHVAARELVAHAELRLASARRVLALQ